MRDFANAHNDLLDPDGHLWASDPECDLEASYRYHPELDTRNLDDDEDADEGIAAEPEFMCPECGAELAYESGDADVGLRGYYYCPVCDGEQ